MYVVKKTNNFQLVKGKSKHFPNTNVLTTIVNIIVCWELETIEIWDCITPKSPIFLFSRLTLHYHCLWSSNNCERWAMTCWSVCGGANCVQCWRPSLLTQYKRLRLYERLLLWDVLREEGVWGDCWGLQKVSVSPLPVATDQRVMVFVQWWVGLFSNLRN